MKKQYLVNDISIIVEESANRAWNAWVRFEMERQLDGFTSEKTGRYLIRIRDIDTFDFMGHEVGKKKLIPGAYEYWESKGEEYFFSKGKQTIINIGADGIVIYTGKMLRYSMPFLCHLIWFKDGKYFVHSAGVQKKGLGFLVCGFGGIGKTAFIAKVAEKNNVRVMGDDINLVDECGGVTPYLRPFCVYEYHTSMFVDYFKKKPVKINKATFFKRAVRRIMFELGCYSKIEFGYMTLSPHKVFDGSKLATSRVPLSGVLLVDRGGAVEDGIITIDVETEEAVDVLTNIMLTEWNDYLKDLIILHSFRGEGFDGYVGRVREIIAGAIRGVAVKKMVIPMSMSPDKVAESMSLAWEGDA